MLSGCMKTSIYSRHRFPPDVIKRAVWLYFRFNLSFRDVEELMAERGVDVSYETLNKWIHKFGRLYAKRIKARSPRKAWAGLVNLTIPNNLPQGLFSNSVSQAVEQAKTRKLCSRFHMRFMEPFLITVLKSIGNGLYIRFRLQARETD